MLLINCSSVNTKSTTINSSIELKVDSLLKLMTIEEKIGQLNQYNGFWNATGPTPIEGKAAKKHQHLKNGWVGAMLNVKGVKEVRALQKIAVEQTRLGIPLLFGFDVIHGHKTISPIPLAEAASWDLEAIKKSAQMAAEEAAAEGINWTFAPMVDVTRDARWGRVMEGAGEDPYLGSKIAYARVKGFQGDDLSSEKTIAACAKHFAGYGFAEAGRDYNTVDTNNETLENIIFPPFRATIEADVKTFMNSFNELNAIPATGNKYLQRDVLKGKWNFKGFVVSDWGSISEMINHGYAKDSKHAAEIAINAGSDMDMESYAYVDYLKELVAEKKVDIKKIDEAVKRILTVKYELGLFDDPYKYCNEQRELETVGKKEFLEGVLDMAKKSIVLLKNDNQLLPLKKSGLSIGLIGDLADDKTSPLGSWRLAAEENSAVSVLEGMNKYTLNKVQFSRGVKLTTGETDFIFETPINTSDRTGLNEAVDLAKNVEVVIMVLGEHGLQSGEGRSRTQIGLPGLQQEMLEEVYKVNKNIVLVLANGRPLAIPWAAKHIPAIVESWQLGTQSGNAIAQVLYGDYNPSGKLPMSFPRSSSQTPVYYNHKNTGRPISSESNSVFWSHYIDEKNDALFPFGYGLSYTNFEYSNFKLDKNSFSNEDSIKASVTLTNKGNFEGKEVVQLYIRDLIGSYTRPVKELKDFKMITLKPNETTTVEFEINKKTIEFYTANGRFEAESGDFHLFVGGSSATQMKLDFTYN